MDSLDLNIKLQNLKYYCCTCLNKLSDEKHNIDEMVPPIFQLLQQLSGCNVMQNDLYPKCVCDECFKKLEAIYDFKRMSQKSMLFLEEFIKSFQSNLNLSPTQSEERDKSDKKETCSYFAVSTGNYNFNDPLQYSDGFEEVLIKTEITNEAEKFTVLRDNSKECESNTLLTSLIEKGTILNNDELISQKTGHCFQCDKCERYFDRKGQLKNHMIQEHNESLTKKILCKFGCGKSFRLMKTAEEHYNKIHKTNTLNASLKKQKEETLQKQKTISLKTKISEKLKDLGCSLPSKKKHQTRAEKEIDEPLVSKTSCPICLKNYCSVSGLNVHMRIHLDERPFQCNKCNRGFNKRALLTNHLKEMHSEVPIKINCKYGCGRVFHRQDSAMNHYRLKHILPSKGIKPDYTRVCEECGKVFKNISILKEHRNIHLPPEKRPYKCDQCDKRFSMKKNLTMHLMRHAGIKNFECTVCGLKTTTRRELRLHMNYHTKELRVECPICLRAFNSASNMKRHEKVVHQGIKNYTCRFCSESFGKPDTLKHHEMRHTGERPHTCPLCERSFIQLVALKAHMKTHNKP